MTNHAHNQHPTTQQSGLDEALSAAIDGQGKTHEHRFVAKRLCEEPGASAKWERYHLARAIMQQESSISVDLSERVKLAIEPMPIPKASRRPIQWLKPVAGAAIAASVAMLAVFGINQSQIGWDSSGAELGSGFVSQTTPMDRIFTQPATPVGFGNAASQADRQRLEQLLLQHQQAARGAGVGNYWPVVTLTPNQGSATPDEGERLPRDQ